MSPRKPKRPWTPRRSGSATASAAKAVTAPPGGWLAAHVGPGWKERSAAEKAEHGFRNTKNLTVRAKTCTDCHVGGDRAEVNHDLYAAGHPPLQYEYSSFLDRYRPYQHWSEADDRRRCPAYEAEAWAVGQAVTARAALDLLAKRARPWRTRSRGSRGRSSPSTIVRRATTASNSNASAPPRPPTRDAVLVVVRGHDAAAARPAVGRRTGGAARRNGRRRPDPKAVADGAATLARVYDEWLNHHPTGGPWTADVLRGRLALLTGPKGQEMARGGWEEARRLAFAVSAYYRSLEASEPDPTATAALRRLEDLVGTRRRPSTAGGS